jgi:H+-transporting ATPase
VLNDGAILSIAYDNVHYKQQPEAWNMRLVLGIATVLGLVGPVAAFGLFYLGDRVFHLGHPQLQTLMYLMLSVAGHLTIFLTRTRGPLWSIRPARILWIAVLGTQTIATLIAVYGLFMTPLGWKLAGLVWGYALVWALLTDRVKLLGYRFLDHAKADEPKPEVKADAPKPEPKADAPKQEGKATEPKPDDKAGQPKPEAKAQEPKPEIKAENKPEATAEAKPEAKAEPQPEAKAKTPSDLEPQIAKLAYELYEERGRGESPAVQDWKRAEREIRKDEAKSDPKAQAKVEPETGPKPETSPEVKADSKSKTKAADPEPGGKDESTPGTKTNVPSDLTPQIVKRVHELYEELGREDLRAVEDLEKAERENRKEGTRAEANPEPKAEPKARV